MLFVSLGCVFAQNVTIHRSKSVIAAKSGKNVGRLSHSNNVRSQKTYGIQKRCSQQNISINFPRNSIETPDHYWEVVSIKCRKNETILTKKVTPKDAPTYILSGHEEFIEDADTGNKYYIQNSEIGFEKYQVILHNISVCYFKESYPVLPSHVRRINVSSGSQYYIMNFRIR
jgi:hypothetical protein